MPFIKDTTETLPLFDEGIAEQKKQEALDQVESNANPEWVQAARAAVKRVAENKPYFTSDDVWIELEQNSTITTHNPAAMGAVMKFVQSSKLGEATGKHKPSIRTKTHKRQLMIWKSNLCATDTWDDIRPTNEAQTIVIKEPNTDELTIKKLIAESNTTAKSKGWWDKEINVGEKLALIHSEISEALEEYRSHGEKKLYKRETDGKPEGFVFELADTMIRIADLCGELDLDLTRALEIKMKFNKTRPYRHGDKKI